MTKLIFVIPDPQEFISGGNIYNAKFIDALTTAGINTTHISFEEFLQHNDIDAQYIFDTIYFEIIAQKHITVPAGSIALIHHLKSLYPLSHTVFLESDLPVLNQFSGFIATSKFTKEYLLSKGIERPICVIEPVAAENVDSVDDVAAVEGAASIKGIMLNNVVERKGVLPFLKALARERIPAEYSIIIVGDLEGNSEYTKACQDLVSSDSLLSGTIAFSGSQDDASVSRIFSTSNLFISASYMETFGMSIQEASVRGLPLLIHEGGNTANHVEVGINGWTEKSMTEMAKRLNMLVTQPSVFTKMRDTANEYQHAYLGSWSEAATILQDFISKSEI